MTDTADNIRAERARRRLSQAELASLAGLAEASVYNAECDRKVVSKTTIDKICAALQLPIEAISPVDTLPRIDADERTA